MSLRVGLQDMHSQELGKNGMWLNRFLFRSLMSTVILEETDLKLAQHQIGAAKVEPAH